MRLLAAFPAAVFLMTATQFAHAAVAQDKGPANGFGNAHGPVGRADLADGDHAGWDPMPSALGFKVSSKSGVITTLSKTATRHVFTVTVFGVPIERFLEATGEGAGISESSLSSGDA